MGNTNVHRIVNRKNKCDTYQDTGILLDNKVIDTWYISLTVNIKLKVGTRLTAEKQKGT